MWVAGLSLLWFLGGFWTELRRIFLVGTGGLWCGSFRGSLGGWGGGGFVVCAGGGFSWCPFLSLWALGGPGGRRWRGGRGVVGRPVKHRQGMKTTYKMDILLT